MTQQFSSPYFSHDSWYIFYHSYDNSPWYSHISPPAKPPSSQYEVQRYWEAAWRSDLPSPHWDKNRLPEPKRWHKETGRVCEKISCSGALQMRVYHAGRADLEPAPALPHFPAGQVFRARFQIAWTGTSGCLNTPPLRIVFMALVSYCLSVSVLPYGSYRSNSKYGLEIISASKWNQPLAMNSTKVLPFILFPPHRSHIIMRLPPRKSHRVRRGVCILETFWEIRDWPEGSVMSYSAHLGGEWIPPARNREEGVQVGATREWGRSVRSGQIGLTTIFGIFNSDDCPGASA